jgi:hypothetical protein
MSNCLRCPWPVGFDRLFLWICDFCVALLCSPFSVYRTKLFNYLTAWQHFVFMYSYHEGPKIDAQYLVSVQAPKQFQAVLIGTFHQNFLSGAEFLLRTWRSFRSLGYSSHIWNLMTPFRVQNSFPWTLYRVSGIQSALGNPISFRVQFWPYIYIYPRVLSSVSFHEALQTRWCMPVPFSLFLDQFGWSLK